MTGKKRILLPGLSVPKLTTQTGERTSLAISKMKIAWSLIKNLWDTSSMITSVQNYHHSSAK